MVSKFFLFFFFSPLFGGISHFDFILLFNCRASTTTHRKKVLGHICFGEAFHPPIKQAFSHRSPPPPSQKKTLKKKKTKNPPQTVLTPTPRTIKKHGFETNKKNEQRKKRLQRNGTVKPLRQVPKVCLSDYWPLEPPGK